MELIHKKDIAEQIIEKLEEINVALDEFEFVRLSPKDPSEKQDESSS
jgi:hypothetical protein